MKLRIEIEYIDGQIISLFSKDGKQASYAMSATPAEAKAFFDTAAKGIVQAAKAKKAGVAA